MIESDFEKVYTDDMETVKDIASIMQSIITMLAIIVSGFWGYWVFIKNRQQYPRMKLSHLITYRRIEKQKILLHINVTVQNVGGILLSLNTEETRIQKVIPLPETVAECIDKGIDPVTAGESAICTWTLLGSHVTSFQKNLFEVEPGEVQELHHDFVIPDTIKTVLVYSYLKNIKKRNREIGWNLITFYDIV